MNFQHIKHPDYVLTDIYMSGTGWWAHKYLMDFLPEYRGRWCVTFALPKGTAPGMNFPAVIDDFGNLVRAS